MEKFLERTAGIYRHPRLVVGLGLLVTVFLGLGLPMLRFDSGIRSMLPSDNRDLLANDYYEDEARFGKGSALYIGVQGPDAFSVESLGYVRFLLKKVDDLSQNLPSQNTGRLLGLGADQARAVVQAFRDQGVNEQSFTETFLPLLLDPTKAVQEFHWERSMADLVAARVRGVSASKLYTFLENPVRNTQSLVNADSVANRDDALVSEKILADSTPIDEGTALAAKKKIEGWDVYQDTLYSRDHTLSGVVVQLNSVDVDLVSSLVAELRTILGQNTNPRIKTYLDGEGVIAAEMGATMKADLRLLMPLVVLIVLVVLFVCFRNVQGVLYPMVVVLMGVVSSLGAMGWLGVPISIASVTLPPLMVAIASAYGIHQVNHYLLDPSTDRLTILTDNIRVVGLAILLSGITVMIGFGALVAEDFVPIRNFGLFTAWGDLVAVAAALWVLPALILVRKGPRKTRYHEVDRDLIGWVLTLLVSVTRRHARKIVWGTLALTVAVSLGIFGVKSELNNVSFFKNESPVHEADDVLNRELAGTQLVSVVLDTDLVPPKMGVDGWEPVPSTTDPVPLTTPEVLKKVDAFSTEVKRKFPYVGKVMSFVDVLKKMNQEMNGGSPEFHKIPDDANLISQYLLIFSGDLQSQLSSGHDKLRIAVTLKRVGTDDSERVAEFARQYFDSSFRAQNHLKVEITGGAHLYFVANSLLLDGMLKSLVICVVLVFGLLVLLLRNLRMTLIAMIPIGATLVINFGILGLLGIPLNTATAMVSSIAVGIGVDYSIHFITWYRFEVRQDRNIEAALERSILRKGRAILYNFFVIVAGFLVLVFSNFVPLVQFGFLVAVCMVTTAFGALVIVPAVIKVLAQKKSEFLFLPRKGKEGSSPGPRS